MTMGRFSRTISLLLALSLCLAAMTGSVWAAGDGWREEAPLLDAQSRYYNYAQGEWTGADNQKMVQIARAQVGLHGYELGFTEPWSADFVCDVARLAGISQSVIDWNAGDASSLVPDMYAKLLELGAKAVSPAAALPGDLILLDPTGSGNPSSLSHIAIVVCYDSTLKELYYIGGYQGTKEGAIRREVSEEVYTSVRDGAVVILRPNYATSDPTTPEHLVLFDAQVEGNGSVLGTGRYLQGTNATLTAVPGDHSRFVGWFGPSGALLSTKEVCTFAVRNSAVVTARFEDVITVTCTASRSGAAEGAGVYRQGAEVTMKAVFDGTRTRFAGWYNAWGELVSEDAEYTFYAEKDTTLYALFGNDVFADIPAGAWYLSDAMEAVDRGLTNGTTAVTFEGSTPYTRAMAAVMLYRLHGTVDGQVPDPIASPFPDVKPGSWYGSAVLWAYNLGVVKGDGEGNFGPGNSVSRQDFFTMSMRYMRTQGVYTVNPDTTLPYSDSGEISDYARDAIIQAQSMGLIKGDDTGKLRPRDMLSRSEGATFMVRIARYLEEHKQEPQTVINYSPNGGAFVGPVSDHPDPPEREGYTFMGWSLQREGGEVLTQAQIDALTGIVTLYAQWEAEPAEPEKPVEPEPPADEETHDYVLNTSTMKFHLADCESIDKIPRDHMERVNAARSSIIAQGYVPCDYCNP